jgi:hypothetical protein
MRTRALFHTPGYHTGDDSCKGKKRMSQQNNSGRSCSSGKAPTGNYTRALFHTPGYHTGDDSCKEKTNVPTKYQINERLWIFPTRNPHSNPPSLGQSFGICVLESGDNSLKAIQGLPPVNFLPNNPL